ncbi:MAG: phenylalanine--tRNA ligase subunit beta [Solirubrobacterales bacterium]|nr:phenylalanine--tRNA ligase subunit beta [Solirubrobacterales bacterium]
MRLPLEWLYRYCRPDLDTDALARRLALTGTGVERVEHHGPRELHRFVIGKVLEAGRHPRADRLCVCRVDIGDREPVQIVCGAPNVRAGQTVAVAQPGAVMPDGTPLSIANLRGVDSHGMILAEDELALGPDHEGIVVLDSRDLRGTGLPQARDGLVPGTPLSEVIPLATDVLELEITPNRPDCLGIYGVAREVHAATGAALQPPPWNDDPGTPGDVEGAGVAVDAPPELCPRFTARVFDDVHIGPSPPWLKARLMAAGQRPISNVVDITNYVMLEAGQPLHAFDLDRVAGHSLVVRQARRGETMRTLDGQLRELDEQMVLIADDEGPTSIAGVMGGERSEVSDATMRVLLEVATWNGPNIHRTSLKLGLRSEASTRYEKQLQPEQAMEAQAEATRLMVELCGARLAPGTIDIGGPGRTPRSILLRDERVAGLLGAPIPRARCQEILEALQFAARDTEDGLTATPPPFRRADVTREADVIEEVARIDGFDRLPATLPSRHGASGRLTDRQRLRRRAVGALVAQGLDEAVGWSFASPELARRLHLPEHLALELLNPMSSSEAELRTTLLGSLLDVVARNRNQGARAVRVFEVGNVYLPSAERLPREPERLAALVSGPVRPATWREQAPREADFFAAKGVLAALLGALRVPCRVERREWPFLHPGRAAAVTFGGQEAGWLGEIHPLVLGEWDLDGSVAGFEVDLDPIFAAATGAPSYVDLTTFPAVREDLAVVVPEGVPAQRVQETMLAVGAPLLAAAELFDTYRDAEQIGSDRVSLAFHLEFRAPDRTLTDEEVAAKRVAIGQALRERLGGRVREGT